MFRVYVSEPCTNIFGKTYYVPRTDESLGRNYSIKGLWNLINQNPSKSFELTPEIHKDLKYYSKVRQKSEQQRLKMFKISK